MVFWRAAFLSPLISVTLPWSSMTSSDTLRAFKMAMSGPKIIDCFSITSDMSSSYWFSVGIFFIIGKARWEYKIYFPKLPQLYMFFNFITLKTLRNKTLLLATILIAQGLYF